jgi:hypothetical protein
MKINKLFSREMYLQRYYNYQKEMQDRPLVIIIILNYNKKIIFLYYYFLQVIDQIRKKIILFNIMYIYKTTYLKKLILLLFLIESVIFCQILYRQKCKILSNLFVIFFLQDFKRGDSTMLSFYWHDIFFYCKLFFGMRHNMLFWVQQIYYRSNGWHCNNALC